MSQERVIIIMPAYNAERTLEATISKLPHAYDEIILCDDASSDRTYALAERLNLSPLHHEHNRGYGGNQKTLFDNALTKNHEIIVMVHPDDQYDTKCIPDMIDILRSDTSVGLVMGSRMRSALKNNMPRWKYISNRFLTACQNAIFRTDLSEFHSGLRAYSASALIGMPYNNFSDGFVFDSEIIAWLVGHGFKVKEVETDCRYEPESSSLGLLGSFKYGFLTLGTLGKYILGRYKR